MFSSRTSSPQVYNSEIVMPALADVDLATTLIGRGSAEKKVTIDPALVREDSSVRQVALSVIAWQNNIKLKLISDKPTFRDQAAEPGTHTEPATTRVLGDLKLRVFADRSLFGVVTPTAQFIDIGFSTMIVEDERQALDRGLRVQIFSSSGQPIYREGNSLNSGVAFPRFFADRWTTEDKKNDELRAALAPKRAACYVEGVARGYFFASTNRSSQQLVGNDRLVGQAIVRSSDKVELTSNQLLNAFPGDTDHIYRSNMRFKELEYPRKQHSSEVVLYLFNRGLPIFSNRHLATVVGRIVAGDYPYQVEFKDRDNRQIFLKHFEHLSLVNQFVAGLSDGVFIGDRFLHPLFHRIGQT
jgi:hypothetical protein